MNLVAWLVFEEWLDQKQRIDCVWPYTNLHTYVSISVYFMYLCMYVRMYVVTPTTAVLETPQYGRQKSQGLK